MIKADRFDVSAKGVYLIAVTPFRDNGDLDLESTDRMVDFYIGSSRNSVGKCA